jgi:hypothetical protein
LKKIISDLNEEGMNLELVEEEKIQYENSSQSKKVDFAIKKDGILKVGIEVNFYTNTGSKPTEIKRSYREVNRKLNDLGIELVWVYPETEIANMCMLQKNFGLTIDAVTRQWTVILNSNLNIQDPYNLSNQNNTDNSGLDTSWFVAFVWTGKGYSIRYRFLNYIFESEKETGFFIDNTTVNYDYTSNTVIKDKIDVLAVNAQVLSANALGREYSWQIDRAVVEVDGYVQPKKVEISLYDYNNSGQIIDPDSFTII